MAETHRHAPILALRDLRRLRCERFLEQAPRPRQSVGRRVSEYGYRDYGPEWGRWASRDPIGDYGGANHYAFVLNQPVALIDLLGLSWTRSLAPSRLDNPLNIPDDILNFSIRILYTFDTSPPGSRQTWLLTERHTIAYWQVGRICKTKSHDTFVRDVTALPLSSGQVLVDEQRVEQGADGGQNFCYFNLRVTSKQGFGPVRGYLPIVGRNQRLSEGLYRAMLTLMIGPTIETTLEYEFIDASRCCACEDKIPMGPRVRERLSVPGLGAW